MSRGFWHKSTRIREGAVPIDNVTKHAWEESDFEEYEEWIEYTEDELVEVEAREAEEAKKNEQQAFLDSAPAYFAALTSAFGEVE